MFNFFLISFGECCLLILGLKEHFKLTEVAMQGIIEAVSVLYMGTWKFQTNGIDCPDNNP